MESVHLADFIGDVRERYRPALPDSFWDCESAFRKLLSSGFHTSILNRRFRDLLEGSEKPADWIGSELVLHRGGGFALSMVLLETPQRYIHSLPCLAMYSPIGEGSLHCGVYEFPANYKNEVFSPDLALTAAGARSVSAGNVLMLDGERYAYDFSSDGPVVVLKFMTTAITPLEWLFSRTGLKAWQANDSDLVFTQLRVAADVIGRFAHQSSLEPLKKLAEHRHHAVRWAAIQNLARLSRSEAVTKLKLAVNDPHPHVQRAAQNTLHKLNVAK